MPPGTLACVAYTAARIVRGPCHSLIHDHGRGLVVRVGGTLSGTRVGLYDYDRGGSFSGELPHLWDEVERLPVSLRVDGLRFEAVCRDSMVRGAIEGCDVTLFDSSGVAHRYSVEPL